MKQHVIRYTKILIGCLIVAVGIDFFILPAKLLAGGLSGIALIGHYLFDLPTGAQIFVLNMPLLVASYKLLGKLYTVDVIVGTFIVSACIDALSFLSSYNTLDDPMLSAITGGVVCGIGFGIVFRCDGNTGGVDIIGMILKKYYGISLGGAVFGVNCLITLAGMLLFGLKVALFTLISIYLTGELTDRVIAGFNRRKNVIIISNKSNEIAREILGTMTRGVTFLKGEGAFTGQSKNIIFAVVSLTQIGKIKHIADIHDPTAFMIISDVNEVSGRGFTVDTFATDEEILRLKKQ